MRSILMIIVHCSAVKPSQRSSAADIDSWHRESGFQQIGYHFVVRRNGQTELGRPIEKTGAHCRHHNRYSIGVCYEGGLDEYGRPADTRTKEQKAALWLLLKQLKSMFPMAVIVGHHDLDSRKACPCFDAATEYGNL